MRFDPRCAWAVLAVLLAVLLTGCRASGTVEVRSSEEVAVDLVFVDVSYEQSPCNPHEWGPNFPLQTQPGVSPDGRLTCRVHGVTHPARLSGHLTLTAAGEYLWFGYNPLAIGPDGRLPIGDPGLDIDELDLTVTFPGRVLGSSGVVDGATVRFVDAQQLRRPYGLHATALIHAGPEWFILGPILGLVAGLALAAGWSFLRERGRQTAADDGAVPPVGAPVVDSGLAVDADRDADTAKAPPAPSTEVPPFARPVRPDDSRWAPSTDGSTDA